MQAQNISLTQSAEYLRLALPLMSRYGIPVTPANYAVWYEYVSGANQQLNKKIDEHLNGGHVVDQKFTMALYEEFIDLKKEFSKLDEVHQRFANLQMNFSIALEEACENTTEFSNSIDSCKSIMDEDATPEIIGSLLRQLSTSTNSMLDKNRTLLNDLNSAKVEIADLKQQLTDAKQQAKTDTLTSLANRKAFLDHMQHHVDQLAHRYTKSSLILLDIDHFKNINDNFGHLFGDKVIRAVSEVLRRNTKGKDLAARFGGEEFIIHLPETDIHGAKVVAESIRKTIESASIINPMSKKVVSRVTVSLGITELLPQDQLEDAVARADKALYAAKNSGRNKLCVAETGSVAFFEATTVVPALEAMDVDEQPRTAAQ